MCRTFRIEIPPNHLYLNITDRNIHSFFLKDLMHLINTRNSMFFSKGEDKTKRFSEKHSYRFWTIWRWMNEVSLWAGSQNGHFLSLFFVVVIWYFGRKCLHILSHLNVSIAWGCSNIGVKLLNKSLLAGLAGHQMRVHANWWMLHSFLSALEMKLPARHAGPFASEDKICTWKIFWNAHLNFMIYNDKQQREN